jgi:hypothetical protein
MALTIRFHGRRGIALLIVGAVAVCAAPRIVVPLPSTPEMESAVRSLWSREILARWAPFREGVSADSARAISVAIGNDLAALEQRTISAIGVRRSLIGPPFGARWTYLIRVSEARGRVASFYRMSRGLAYPSSRTAWMVRLF